MVSSADESQLRSHIADLEQQLAQIQGDYDRMAVREANLRASEQRFRSILRRAREVIFQTDRQGRWLFLSQGWQGITGLSVDHSLGRSWLETVAPSDQMISQTIFRQVMEREVDLYRHEFRLISTGREERWLEMVIQPDLDGAGQLQGASGTLCDVSERKAAEALLRTRANELTRINAVLLQTTALLEQRNQELDQFAYVASHDLKAPLRAIANLSAWIEEDLGEMLPPENQHQMQLLRGRVHRMEALINGLLAYSRVGRVETPVEHVDVGDLVHRILQDLAPPDTFTIDISPDLPSLRTKRLPLSQVFANLLSNSIKYCDRSDAHLKVEVEDEGQYYAFSVSDNGPGIAPRYHNKVFVIFQTLESRDRVESTGIGLSIVRKVVEGEGGKVTLISQVGEGATFRFTWPKSSP